MRKKVEINNYMKKRQERRLKRRLSSDKKLIWLRDCSLKWIKKEWCYKRKEDKRKNIYQRCWLKMISTRSKHKLKKKEKDWKMLKLSKSMLRCLKDKNKIDWMSSSLERKELKISWIKWQILSLRRWMIDRKMKRIRSRNMKWKKNLEIDWKMKRGLKRSKMNNKEWEISWLSRWMRRKEEKILREISMESRLQCGSKINRIIMKRKEDSMIKSIRLIRKMLISLRDKCKKKKPKKEGKWINKNSYWINHYWKRSMIRRGLVNTEEWAIVYLRQVKWYQEEMLFQNTRIEINIYTIKPYNTIIYFIANKMS